MCRTIVVTLVILECVVLSLQFEFTNTFGHCLKQDNPNLIKCAGQQAIESLQQINDVNNFSLADGFVLSKDETVMGRSSPINLLDQDPTDLRSILESAGAVMGERSIQWDMSRLIPGLQLRIGPSITGGLMEFVVDPNSQYDERSHVNFEQESTARVMSRKFVLPFLLGLKFNLATLLPLILGAIILISKKAAILSKLALFISGFFGLGGLSSLGGFGGGYGGGYDGHAQHGYGFHKPSLYGDSSHAGLYKVLENNTPRSHEQEQLQQQQLDHFYDYDKKHLIKDRSSRLYEREVEHDKRTPYRANNQRSFAWATANTGN